MRENMNESVKMCKKEGKENTVGKIRRDSNHWGSGSVNIAHLISSVSLSSSRLSSHQISHLMSHTYP